ncbi:Receptor L-domain domain-containing protein [Caenorhabditis elegans]|uniref:Receptor L-domain domain-containing protein n=1 Tax=Caenorhabditis elegans TaxID=6239 RepID=Q9N4N7_CAEEL|nr:Receptor L-domain domain-containing protein [Caenorhabditis elegans]CCD73707.2 Receptor L-domain domain-containing protein [Caenorhabditis elegans]
MTFVVLTLCFMNFQLISTDFYMDIQEIMSVEKKCKPNCLFNHTEISSKTIDFFPRNCSKICGILVINSNTDLSENDLEDLFENVNGIYGGVKMENSSLTNISFLKSYPNNFNISCTVYGVSIINNSQLINLDAVKEFFFSIPFDECSFQVKNNPKLDANDLCEFGGVRDMVTLQVSGNLRDCGCRGDFITTDNILEYQNCTVLNGGLRLSNFSSSENLMALSKVKQIKGDVEIQWNNITGLFFLKSLTTILSTNGRGRKKVIVNIHDNYEMKRLGFEKINLFWDLYGGKFFINLQNLHPDFCLTIQEMMNFLAYVKFTNIQAKYCSQNLAKKIPYLTKPCAFSKLSSSEENCTALVGNVVVDANDGRYLYKLFKIKYIFGTLKIQYSKSDGLYFLTDLNYIGNLDASIPAVLIRSNNYLIKPNLPVIMNIISSSGQQAVIYDNQLLPTDYERCSLMSIGYDAEGYDIELDNQDCGKLSNGIFTGKYIVSLLFFLVALE